MNTATRLTIILTIFIILVYNTFGQNMLYEGSGCISSGGYRGTCQRIINCDNRGHRINISDFCSFSLNLPIYCCPHILKIPLQLPKPRTLEDLKNLRPIDQIQAGAPLQRKPTRHDMAAIGWTNFDGGVDWRCGGTVIFANFILTAAHCTTSRGILPDIIRIGDLNLLVDEDYTAPEDFRIIEIFTHPQYKPSELYHDIALLKITGDYRKLENLKAACIWTRYDIPEKRLTAMGYGATAFGGPLSNELFQGVLIQQLQKDCIIRVPITADLPRGIIRGQLCAHDPNNIMDTCQGDSGGPLQFDDFSVDFGRQTIVGITSFGQNCIGNIPGVYTRVSEYVDWIESTIKPDFNRWWKQHKNKTEGWSSRYYFE